MRTLVALYIRLKYLLVMDIPLWLSERWFEFQYHFMSREQQRRELQALLRRMMFSPRLSTEDKRMLMDAWEIVKDMDK